MNEVNVSQNRQDEEVWWYEDILEIEQYEGLGEAGFKFYGYHYFSYSYWRSWLYQHEQYQ